MKIDKSQINVRIKSLAELRHPSELYNFFRQFKPVYYTYGFLYKGVILKYGESTRQSSTKIFGERVVRQVANITNGWGVNYSLPSSSSGDEMIKLCNKFKKQHGVDIDRNDMQVIIYDMTHYCFEYPETPWDEVKQCEAEQIEEFRLQYGRLPIGNVKSERSRLTSKKPCRAVMDLLF
jgi:hypothetical protein